jgi:hypothetical protein
MKNKTFPRLILCCGLILLAVSATFPQKRKPAKAAVKAKEIVFAVLNDGKTIEPIGVIDKGGLVPGSEENTGLKTAAAFNTAYYKPKTAYNLVFGGTTAGTITIKSSNPKAECAANLAEVATVSTKAKLKGLVMGLATNVEYSAGSGMRRMPTTAERSEIESLVRAELSKNGVSANAVKNLKYHNLTALDVDNDGKAEMVGTYWAENSAKERNQLFFIAEQNKSGKYEFGYSEYQKVTPDQVMTGELKDLDDGHGNELLLDAMEYNGDKTAEIFTIGKAFEGNNFYVYSRDGKTGKWKRVFESYNYHCAF